MDEESVCKTVNHVEVVEIIASSILIGICQKENVYKHSNTFEIFSRISIRNACGPDLIKLPPSLDISRLADLPCFETKQTSGGANLPDRQHHAPASTDNTRGWVVDPETRRHASHPSSEQRTSVPWQAFGLVCVAPRRPEVAMYGR